ncbi:uncharacterized protein F4822DRAFT_240769 [Hypoxylon trugodes]|uniref:uncharacterized protein n=1 Tax=Hypoxylon trugodes TaxID=326681 RepID=UPI002198DF24|nr:uncharacterized protein F4822DRAFT_240769 [Hypoxylon trugodes]KAI1388286.1 hypothetical protein F4822DRAFT_240769 [Hypoxylon trugodes]
MQLTMGRSTHDHQISLAAPARQAPTKPDPYRQRHRRNPKSQPFDADDLRQRLYLVIMEREAMEEGKKRERIEEEKRAKKAQAGKTHLPSDSSFAARMARSESTAESKGSRLISKPSILRRKASKAVESTPPYHHVPQEAAAQFARTATAHSMRERASVHSLSHSQSQAQDTGINPAQQNRALERALSHRTRGLEERRSSEDSWNRDRRRPISSSSSKAGPRRKSSNHFGNIMEDETLPVRSNVVIIDPPIDEISSEETLVVDPAVAVNEHRVDWTQSDEMCQKRRSSAGTIGRIPLLRKADSLWTLKGKLGGAKAKNVVREKTGEGSTPPSSQPKFSRLGFLMRFKR